MASILSGPGLKCAEVTSMGGTVRVCCEPATHVIVREIAKGGTGKVYGCLAHADQIASRAGTFPVKLEA